VSARTPGVRPRLLAVLVSLIALAVLGPWLSDLEWRGEAGSTVGAVLEGRPFSQPERAGYLILGIAADALLPSSTTRALNILGLVTGVLAALAVGRLRSALTRGGTPLDRLLEPLVTATALVASGPFLVRAVSADPAAVEVFLAATAAALAWTGRFPSGMAVFGLLLFVSSRAFLTLPMLLFAPRPRGDLRTGLVALVPWLLYALILRPGLHPSGDPAPARDAFREALVLAIGVGGIITLAAVGGAVGLIRGGPHRRFVFGLLATMLLHLVLLVPRAGWVESAVPLTPWWAVLAGSGVGSLRRAATRVLRLPLGRPAAGFGLLILALNLGLAVRYDAAPTWRRASHYRALCRELRQALVNPHRLAGGWHELKLFEVATDSRSRAWAPIPGAPFPDRPLAVGEREVIDRALGDSHLLLLRRLRFAVILAQDSLGTAQILKPVFKPVPDEEIPLEKRQQGAGEPRPAGGVATFCDELVLERTDVVMSPQRQAGGLVTVRLHWHAKWPGGGLPAAVDGERVAPALRVATSVVDAGGRVGPDLSHWLAFGLAGLRELGGRRFDEVLIFRLPPEFRPGDYGVEVAVYEPLAGDAAALDHDLGFFRQRRHAVRTGGIPPGVTPRSVRAASFRLQLPALAR
jgi:hypothetical protein